MEEKQLQTFFFNFVESKRKENERISIFRLIESIKLFIIMLIYLLQ